MTRVLVTCDDGQQALGLRAVARRLAAEFDHVVVVVSSKPCSNSATATRLQDRFEASTWHQTHYRPNSDHAEYTLEAPPSLAVLLASAGAFGPPPDVVLSGVNFGPNVGAPILHSGTFGAAITAAHIGICAIALSLDDVYSVTESSPGELQWDSAVEVAAEAVRRLARGSPGVLLNINVPNWLRSELKGVREAKLLRAVAHPQVSTMLGGTGSQPADRLSSHPTCDDTDVGLLRRGFITVSSLSPPDRPNPDSILEFSTGLERELAKMAFFSPSVDEGRFDG